MKTPNADRNSVITRESAMCVVMSRDDKEKIAEKAKEMGLTKSSLVRMAVKEFLKNH